MVWLYYVEWTQYIIRLEAVSYPYTSFLHFKMPSVTYLWLSDVSVICRVTHFQFPIQFAFLPYIGSKAAPAQRRIDFNTQYRTSDVAENLGISCTERTSQGKDFEFILTVKMETRHPVGGSFGSEFPAICNHRVVAWSRKTWKFCEQFLRVLWKNCPLWSNFQNSVPNVYMATPIDVLICSNVVRFVRRNRALFNGLEKNETSPASQTVATERIALKICLNQPPTVRSQCSWFHPNRFTFGGVIAKPELILAGRSNNWSSLTSTIRSTVSNALLK